MVPGEDVTVLRDGLIQGHELQRIDSRAGCALTTQGLTLGQGSRAPRSQLGCSGDWGR